MSLYNWDSELYNMVYKYYPKFLRNNKNKKYGVEITKATTDVFSMYIENIDVYNAGMQLVLNMGILAINRFPEKDIGIYPSPELDGKHLKKYTATPNQGQSDYFYPYKSRSLIFS